MGDSERDALPAELASWIDVLAGNFSNRPVEDIPQIRERLEELARLGVALGREQGRQEERERCIALIAKAAYGKRWNTQTVCEEITAAIEGREGAGR